MKRNRNLINGLAAMGLALAMATTLSAQTVIQNAAKVVRINGQARCSAAGASWRPLHVGDLVKPGTTIQTSNEKGAYVDLVLDGSNVSMAPSAPSISTLTPANFNPATPPTFVGYRASSSQNVVRIFANSALTIDKLSSIDTGAGTVTDTELDLKVGHIFANVKKMTAGSKYEVKIPNGVAGIRGTTIEVYAEGILKCGVGASVLAYMNSSGQVSTQDVPAGNQFDARTGILSPLPAEDMSFLGALARDTAYVSGSGLQVPLCYDFTDCRPLSPNSGMIP